MSRKQCALTDANPQQPHASQFSQASRGATGHHASPSLTVWNPRRLAAVGSCGQHEAHLAHDSDPGGHGRAGARRRHGGGVWLRRRGRRHRVRPRRVIERPDVAVRLGQHRRPPSLRRPATSPTDSGDPVPSPIINKAVQAAIAGRLPGTGPRRRAGRLDRPSRRTTRPKRGGMWWIMISPTRTAPESRSRSPRTSAQGIVDQYLPGRAAGRHGGPQRLRHRQLGGLHGHGRRRRRQGALRHRGRGGRPRPGHGRRSSPRSCSPPRTPGQVDGSADRPYCAGSDRHRRAPATRQG